MTKPTFTLNPAAFDMAEAVYEDRWENTDCYRHDCLQAAITAYFQSMLDHGLAREGMGYKDNDGNEIFDANRGGGDGSSYFPVIILKQEPEA